MLFTEPEPGGGASSPQPAELLRSAPGAETPGPGLPGGARPPPSSGGRAGGGGARRRGRREAGPRKSRCPPRCPGPPRPGGSRSSRVAAAAAPKAGSAQVRGSRLPFCSSRDAASDGEAARASGAPGLLLALARRAEVSAANRTRDPERPGREASGAAGSGVRKVRRASGCGRAHRGLPRDLFAF